MTGKRRRTRRCKPGHSERIPVGSKGRVFRDLPKMQNLRIAKTGWLWYATC